LVNKNFSDKVNGIFFNCKRLAKKWEKATKNRLAVVCVV
jgi:hypothetical protein